MFSIHSLVFASLPWLHCDMRWCASAQHIYAHLLYHVCNHITFSIHSTTAYLYGPPVICVYGTGLPEVIGSRRWATHCINQDLRKKTRRLTGKETSIKLLVVMSSFSNFQRIHVFHRALQVKSLTRHKSSKKINGVTNPGMSPKLQVDKRQSMVKMNPKWY